ncbi:SPOR domain-containing protein [Polaribacter sp. WD7]|nr:SPOR domain-containing protein [Polaribacter sp. WD7]
MALSCTKKKPAIENISEIEKDSIIKEDKEKVVVVEDKLIFTVQIAALRNENSELENFEDVKIYQEDGFIKYRIGSFLTYEDAVKHKEMSKTFFADAFVQALQNNNPIHIKEALSIK